MKEDTLKTLAPTLGRASAAANPHEYTLDSLVPLLGTFEETVRNVIYSLVSEQDLLKRGKRVASDRILEDMPLFLGSAHDILQSLSDAQRKKVSVEAQIFALCLDETLKLRQLREGHQVAAAVSAGGRAGRQVSKRQAVSALRAARRGLLTSLQNGLDKASLAHAKALAGKAATITALMDGSGRLADYLAQRIEAASEDEQVQLRSFSLTAERVAELRSHLAGVRVATQVAAARRGRVEQRQLDIQDGRVLVLVERILRAFRAAQHEDPTILVPELRALAKLFTSRPGSRGPKKSPPAKTPSTPPAPKPLAVSANAPGTRKPDGTPPPPVAPVETRQAEK
ncbi:MAG TPA: hypothetical protein VH877_03270 [Polyangia bacterium]|jgi:hypothetical protein|nr:hypothetical protein [Polyangia bacterium]